MVHVHQLPPGSSSNHTVLGERFALIPFVISLIFNFSAALTLWHFTRWYFTQHPCWSEPSTDQNPPSVAFSETSKIRDVTRKVVYYSTIVTWEDFLVEIWICSFWIEHTLVHDGDTYGICVMSWGGFHTYVIDGEDLNMNKWIRSCLYGGKVGET